MEEILFSIQNIVVCGQYDGLPNRIEIIKIVEKNIFVSYNPEKFPGVVIPIPAYKATALFFSTGKMVITGVRDTLHIPDCVREVGKIVDPIIQNQFGKIFPASYRIVNMVSTFDLKKPIDLNLGAVTLECSSYEPEIFPGLIYRPISESRVPVVFLLFSTGKVVCTKCKSKEDIKIALEDLIATLEKNSLLIEDRVTSEDDGDLLLI